MASIEYVVNATDAASRVFEKIGLSADHLDRQLKDLGDRVADPEVRLDDAKFTLGMINAAKRLDKLNAQIADPKVEVDTAKAQTEILRINAMLDRLGTKKVEVTVTADRRGFGRALISARAFGGLFGGAGAAAPAAAAAGSPLLDFLASPAGIGTIAAGAFPGISLIDALLGQGLGSGGALLGAGLAKKFRPSALAPGATNIQQTLSTVTQSFAPSLGMMLVNFGKAFQSLAPMLAKFFAATLPFMQQFLTLALQAAKTILPALTQALDQMARSGALKLMTQGFVAAIQGIAAFIKAIGPGFKAGAEIFRAAMLGVKGLLIGLGAVFGWVGRVTGDWLHRMHDDFTSWRHDTAVIFDGVRHDIAAAWNAIVRAAASAWDILVRGVRTALGTLVHLFTGLPPQITRVFHGALSWLYGAGKDVIQGLWNGILFVWHKVTSFISGIANWIKAHKGPVNLDANLLEPAGRALMGGLLRGLTSGFGAVGSFVSGIAGKISGALGGGNLGAQGIAAQMLRSFGWDMGQFGPLVALWNRESGWNRFARNPTSGAYGIPQALPPTKMPFAAQAAGGSSAAAQIAWGLSYIKGRYGSPAMAWAHELQFGWYDRGGWLPPGLSLALNQTGQPERVGGGGNVTINVSVPVSANKAEVGRQIVEAIRLYEQRSGTGWRR